MNINAIRPMNDLVLLKATKAAEKEGSIFLPGCVEFSVWRSGVVVACGPGAKNKRGERQSLPVRPGMKVCFRYCGSKEAGLNDFEVLEDDNRDKYILVRYCHLEFTIEEKILEEVAA